MSTDSEQGHLWTPSPTNTMSSMVNLAKAPLGFFVAVRVATGDSVMSRTKSLLECHVYVLGILTIPEERTSTYRADVDSAYSAYNIALTAEQTLKNQLIHGLPPSWYQIRLSQTYVSQANRAMSLAKGLDRKYGKKANDAMEPDIKANADIANVRFIESINSLNTSLRAVIAKGDSWDYAQKQRFRGPLDKATDLYMKAYHPQKVTYEVTSEMREYLELTGALWRASKELSAGFPGELSREMLWNESTLPSIADLTIVDVIMRLLFDIPLEDLSKIPAEIKQRKDDGRKSTSDPIDQPSYELEMAEAISPSFLDRLSVWLDRRKGEDICQSASFIVDRHMGRPQAMGDRQYLVSFTQVWILVKEAEEYAKHGLETELVDMASRKALRGAKALDRKYGAIVDQDIKQCTVQYIQRGDEVLQKAWELLVANLESKGDESWQVDTRDEILNALDAATRKRQHLFEYSNSFGRTQRLAFRALSYSRRCQEALSLLESRSVVVKDEKESLRFEPLPLVAVAQYQQRIRAAFLDKAIQEVPLYNERPLYSNTPESTLFRLKLSELCLLSETAQGARVVRIVRLTTGGWRSYYWLFIILWNTWRLMHWIYEGYVQT